MRESSLRVLEAHADSLQGVALGNSVDVPKGCDPIDQERCSTQRTRLSICIIRLDSGYTRV